ncbi:MAG: STAS domain-containing protein [Clostridia bacterium]|nr:STAS domain-containing protein [Clostridia bacterium]
MLKITKTAEGKEFCFALEGSLNTNTADEFEKELREVLPNAEALYIDLKDLTYISSAGLRVLLSAQKQMNRQGVMKVKNAGGFILETFEITGFTEILDLE